MLKQDYRDAAVSSPLGEDVLLFRRMVATEHIGTPFQFDLDVVTKRPEIDFDAVLGHDMTVRLRAEGGERFFNGIVQSFALTGVTGRHACYRAVLRPRLWFLSRNRDSRIFPGRSVPDIVKEVLREHALTDIEDRLSGQYQPWEYCVQYQESDFAFVSRLLEHEGIYYYFTHRNGGHTLVLGDGLGAHDTLIPDPRLRYNPDGRRREDVRSVDEWTVTREVTSGAYSVDDYGFERPSADLRAALSMPRPHPLSELEVFEYPAGMTYGPPNQRRATAETYARQRLEEIQGPHARIEGLTTVRRLACGGLFTLTNHPLAAQNREYLVLSTRSEFEVDDYEAGRGGGGGDPYLCRFTVKCSQETYRPPRATPVPVMRGPQTAVVAGLQGEEIWTDKYGRIKVRFHWDRGGRAGEAASCWIRVAQVWAGKRWGAQFLPRIGQEVIVDFLDGDPNRPVVTGSLYNDEVMPPFDLPTRSGLRTDTEKGKGANELWFEDKAGKERVYLHAQRSQDNRVRGSSRESVGGNRHLTVGGAHSAMVEGDRHDIVWTDDKRNADSLLSQMVGLSHHEEVGENHALKAGLDIAIEAGVSITLKASGGFIKIDPTGVVISGNFVRINSGGAPGSLTAAVQEPDEAHGASDGTPGVGGGRARGRRVSRLVANRGRIAKIAAQRVAKEWGAFQESMKPQVPAVAEATKEKVSPEIAHWQDVRDKALLASHAYDTTSKMPEGYTYLDPEEPKYLKELQLLGIKPGDLASEDVNGTFKANIYRKDDGSYIVSFRGTRPELSLGALQDAKTDGLQAFGWPTEAYEKAKSLGMQMAAATDGRTTFVGHSLGGGLASAAAVVTGLPAVTYNAAGLHPNTVEDQRHDPPPTVDAYYVEGEFLSTGQDNRETIITGTAAAVGGSSGILGLTAAYFVGKKSIDDGNIPHAYGTRHELPAVSPDGGSGNMFTKHKMSWMINSIDAKLDEAMKNSTAR